jgi:alkylation response protein AidB-like acyl-CoA dehydrogenase
MDRLAPPTPLDPIDPLTPVGRVAGMGAGEVVGDAAMAAELRLRGAVLAAAMLTGIATRCVGVAVDYALGREQFGAPIGSFQAIKHLLADMHLRSALAQSATYAAAAMVQGDVDDESVRAATGAKLLAGEAAIENASTAIQVLGGMGFTWEMLPNHLLKRSWVLELEFGTADEQADRLGAALLGPPSVGPPLVGATS